MRELTFEEVGQVSGGLDPLVGAGLIVGLMASPAAGVVATAVGVIALLGVIGIDSGGMDAMGAIFGSGSVGHVTHMLE